MKEKLRKIIKEELIKESLMSNILSYIAGYITKSIGNKEAAHQAVNKPDVRKALSDYLDSHKTFVNKLASFEDKYGIKFPADIKEPIQFKK